MRMGAATGTASAPLLLGATMSNHFSSAYLKFPGDDARLDLTDLFVFTTSAHPGTTTLIMDVNPFMAGLNATVPFLMKAEFHPDAVYRINIDSDGDSQADVAFTFVFSDYADGRQTCTVYHATGALAREPGPVGDVLAKEIPVEFSATARPVEAGRGQQTGYPVENGCGRRGARQCGQAWRLACYLQL
jgi:hypothetical protein